MKVYHLPFFISFLLFWGCNSDEYSPNQRFNRRTVVHSNHLQLQKLSTKKPGERIRIALSGDTQRSYAESKKFVQHINARDDIDFVILNGDISDFGLLLEFDGIYRIYAELKVPFIAVIGNHDLVANGQQIYERMFGPLNFTFTYGTVKFVCHDTNGREYDFDGSTPSLAWLNKELTLSSDISHLVAISHVAPTDDDFDPALAKPYRQLLNKKTGVIASIHSHNHQPLKIHYEEEKGIPFIITNAIVNHAYALIDIQNGEVYATEVIF